MWINIHYLQIVLCFLFGSPINRTNSRSTNISHPRLLIESNSIHQVADSVSGQAVNDSRALKRVFLSNRTVTCNDGSQAGFFLRKSSKSKRWVVFLEGGWHCYDLPSCKERWRRSRHLMTSAQWPETRRDGGILSPLPSDNPYWHDANHVLIPYCSSDSWSGTKMRNDNSDGYAFMGSLILRQVIIDLIPLGLGRSQGGELLLAGSSAGGLGVMLNLDKVKKMLREEKQLKIFVRGVSDSGWFLDRNPYAPGAISASEVIKKGWKLWHGSMPEACAQKHSTEPWRCYFGHRLYPTLKSPLFVFQWLFDEAQMRADSVGAPVTPQQWDYIHDMGGALRESLNNVTAVFAPSCIGHAVLTKRDWLNIKIDNISFAEALKCWEQSTGRSSMSRRTIENRRKQENRRQRKRKNHEKNNKNKKKEAQLERHRLSKERKQRQRRKRPEGARKLKLISTTVSPIATIIPRSERSPGSLSPRALKPHHKNESIPRDSNNKKKRRKNALRETNTNRNGNHKRRRGQQNGIEELPARCSLRLLERCSWPQCNHSCPMLTNPLTGEEMRFLELLASFGLDIEAVATALGVDMQTLNNMDHTVLVNLLTQTSS